MKKALALILALMMVLSLAACGGEPTETKGPENPNTSARDPEARRRPH